MQNYIYSILKSDGWSHTTYTILLLPFAAKLNNVPETLLEELSLLGGTEFEAELLDPIKR